MTPSSDDWLRSALFILRILSPAIVLLCTLTVLPARPPPPPSPSPITSVVVASRVPRRALILTLLSFVSFAYLLDGLVYVVFVILNKRRTFTGIDINAVIGIIAFSGLAALGAWKDVQGIDVWSLKRVKHTINLSLDIDFTILVLIALDMKHHPDGPKIPETRYPFPLSTWLHLSFAALRVLLLIPLTIALFFPRTQYTPVEPDDEIIAPLPTSSSLLLPPGSGVQNSTGLSPLSANDQSRRKYGTFGANPWSTPTTRAPTPTIPPSPNALLPKTDEKPEIALDPSWKELGRRMQRLTPYLWPSKSKPLQLLALLCILLLVVGRIVNVLLPLTLGELVKTLEEGEGQWSPWVLLGGYVVLRFLQSSGGLAALRDSLWAPVMQYSDREMSQLSFDHLLNLSFAWHTRRKTGEVLRILDRGAAVNHTLELIMFNVVPTFFDILIALGVFIVKFEWTLALVIFLVMFAYVAASVILTRWRTKIRRQMNERDIITRGIHTDCLLNYETVKYFGGETHEGERYADAIRQYQELEYKVIISLNLLNLVQNFIITLGLLVGSLIVALRVVNGKSKPSDFVIFITYLGQLYGPLNSLGYIYRSINQSLVDTEKLLKLLNEPTEVNDKPNAPDLVVHDGEIEFDNVSFSYDGRNTALSSVSFKVPKGGSVALVGESGSGKSTILRLLYRFYDLREGEGRILIDGKDIRDVTQASLRRSIGVVPQDSVLFNSSIAYNIGYGKFGASPAEIEVAAKAAQMHDRIISFPDKYDTKVGERGVRLSGGEKQRVAIARTLLKNPPILLLDEATSALDTSTEKDIQKALQNLVKGRSSLSIAHRLSTIATADIILVLKDGQIVEQGSHRDLLARDGVFASMWADQISASDDPAISIGNSSTKKEVSGYSADPAMDVPVIGGDLTATPQVDTGDLPAVEAASGATDEPAESPVPVSFPTYATVPDSEIATDAPVDPPIPVAFPAADDSVSQKAPSVRELSGANSPAVTFGAEVNTPPSSTPDPDGEPKKKTISAQNFQRLARRISLTTKRSGSMSSMPLIPGFGQKKEGSKDDTGSLRGEPSTRNSADSPSGSVLGSGDKDKKTKKEKREKERKRKSLI